MYLKRLRLSDGLHYILRESYREGGSWKSRDLLDLGTNPGEHISYPGGNSYCFDPALEETLQDQGVRYSSEELEEVFMPFLAPHVRRVLEMFHRSQATANRWSGCSKDELLRYQEKLHPFDRRRLHYLRCGRVDIGDLEGRPWKFLNVLLEKSRDEIECMLESMEQRLRPHEIKTYIYASFQLQEYFPNHLMRNHPLALDQERVDASFLEALCHINSDSRFFSGTGVRDSGSLHPYLVKYVILYFDHDFGGQSLWEEYMRHGMWRRQFFRQHYPSKKSLSTREACGGLGLSPAEFEKMDRTDLIRHYRTKAKELHPDKGGDHEAFVRMVECFECLLVQKTTTKKAWGAH